MTSPTISIAFQTDKPLAAYGPLAHAAEAYGFDGVSVYNDLLYQPAWLPLLEMARHTRRVWLGPAAVNPFTCHPLTIAGNIALLDEASQGRAYLGLARGAWLDWLGIEPARPIRALREAFACIRHLLTRATAPYPGDIFPLAGGDSLRWPIGRADIPFLLGTWGAHTIRACAPYIAAVKVGGTANPALLRHIVAVVRDAAVRAGRHADSIQVVAGAVTVVDRDGARARAWARRHAAMYLPVIAPLDHTLALEPAVLHRLSAAAAADDVDQVARHMSDDLLRCVAFAGTPEQVAEQAHAVLAVGVRRVEFGTPHGVTEEDGMRWLGEAVLPALRRAV